MSLTDRGTANGPVVERPVRRAIDGLLLLDKPRGITSNRALQIAKRLLEARKAGHTGSLDPLATGLLPLLFGEATKLSQFLLDADKRYWTVVRLGVVTTTHDADGEVVETRPVAISRPALEQALTAFQGEIEQIPPMYSALKQGGQPLYELARAGIEVERAPRGVTVHAIHLLSFESDRVELDITCSKGTYVRTIAHDLGTALGCGAHVAELRRLAVGALRIEDAVDLDTLAAAVSATARAAWLKPADAALPEMPDLTLTSAAMFYLRQGSAVSVRPAPSSGWVRLYGPDRRFLGVGEVLDDGRIAPRRLVAAGG